MNRHGIECVLLKKPKEWKYLKGYAHATEYAKLLWWDEDLFEDMVLQHIVFKRLELLLRNTLTFSSRKWQFVLRQTNLQRWCLNELDSFYERFRSYSRR